MDEWSELLFSARFGSVEQLDILKTDDDVSNEIVEHRFPFSDGAVLQHTGVVPRTTDCTLIFVPRKTQLTNHLQRLVEFLNEAKSVKPLTFVHPLTGSYQANARGIKFSANANSRARVDLSVTFIEAGLEPAAFESNLDFSVGAGVALVNDAKLDVDAAIAADPSLPAQLESPVVQDDALSVATVWRDVETNQRDINLELNRIANRISDETTNFKVATNVSRYPVFLAMQRLHGAIRTAADLAIQTAPELTQHLTVRSESLLSLMTDLYGGEDALDKYDRTRDLNNIRNPARIEAGTTLTIETP